MSQPPTIQLSVTTEGTMYPLDQQHRLLEVAKAADEAGVDYLTVTDHVLMGLGALTSGHGWEQHHLDMVQTDPLITLAAMAGATQRVKLLSSVVIAPLRQAGLLAKMAGTLHAISRGRFVMGVSVSWHKDEYDALGVPFERRGQVLDDTIGACRALWESAPASFHSPTVNFDGMFCQPRPLPGERIPVLFTGQLTPRLIRRVVTLGDGWLPYGGLGLTLEQKANVIRTLRQAYVEAGRDPASLIVCDDLPIRNSEIAKAMEQLPAIAAAGVNIVRAHLRFLSSSPDEVIPRMQEVTRAFEPYRTLAVGS